ncbi:MAG: FeoB-associated Cys-rich membrane protein [Spirochaetia bacterium]|nr:FeoB-associated Cys-rich membrane protein [Spirochaetia bacterium]MDD6929819.1 FeoB-associated Cys-rich membrane protein [Treponema sp.]
MVNVLICIVIGILAAAAVFYIVRTKINAKKNGSVGCIGCSACNSGKSCCNCSKK